MLNIAIWCRLALFLWLCGKEIKLTLGRVQCCFRWRVGCCSRCYVVYRFERFFWKRIEQVLRLQTRNTMCKIVKSLHQRIAYENRQNFVFISNVCFTKKCLNIECLCFDNECLCFYVECLRFDIEYLLFNICFSIERLCFHFECICFNVCFKIQC